MKASLSGRFHAKAQNCVGEMGDIFWDYDAVKDRDADYRDPYEVAAEAVEKVLEDFAVENHGVMGLREEYSEMISALPKSPSDEKVVRALVAQFTWTDRGARELLYLAQQYGTSILRNALALADALEIEDGKAGL